MCLCIRKCLLLLLLDSQAILLASGVSLNSMRVCVIAHLFMLLHEVLNVCILALLGLMDLLLAPQLCIIPQSLHNTNIGTCLYDTHK